MSLVCWFLPLVTRNVTLDWFNWWCDVDTKTIQEWLEIKQYKWLSAVQSLRVTENVQTRLWHTSTNLPRVNNRHWYIRSYYNGHKSNTTLTNDTIWVFIQSHECYWWPCQYKVLLVEVCVCVLYYWLVLCLRERRGRLETTMTDVRKPINDKYSVKLQNYMSTA